MPALGGAAAEVFTLVANVVLNDNRVSSRIDEITNSAKRATTVLSAMGGAAAGISIAPVALTTAAGALTVLAGSFSGVGDAMKAYTKDQDAVQKASRTSAVEASKNARAIKSAEKQVADARKSAAKTARDSGRQIADAEKDVKEAAVDAAEAIRSAKERQAEVTEQGADRIKSAEERVQDAQKDAVRAQEDLTQAREDAAEQLRDLREQTEDYALDEEGASLRVAKAQERLREVMVDHHASMVDRAEAAHDLKVAEDAQADMLRDHKRAQEELNAAEKKGVEGSDRVVAAKEKVTDAEKNVSDAQKDAQKAVTDAATANQKAAEAVANAVKDGAKRQADAEQNLARARESAADSNTAASERVQDALDNLKDAHDAQSESAEKSAAALDTFTDAMKKLTPAQQTLVRQLISMKPLWDNLKDSVSSSFLPGFTSMLKSSEQLFPIFNTELGKMGTTMGDIALKFGALFSNANFQTNLRQALENGNQLLTAFGNGFVKVTEGWFKLAANVDIAKGVADLITGLTNGLADAMSALNEHGDSFGSIVSSVGKIADTLLPAVVDVAGTVADVLSPALSILSDLFVLNKDNLGDFIIQLYLIKTAFSLAFTARTVAMIAGIASAAASAIPGLSGMATWLGRLGSAARVAGGVAAVAGSIAIVGAEWDAFTTTSNEAVDALAKGGKAAADARAEIEKTDRSQRGTLESLGWVGQKLNDLDNLWVNSSVSVNAANDARRASMTNLQRAQEDAAKAQADYSYAVDQFGRNSPEAARAMGDLQAASARVRGEQEKTATSIDNVTDSLKKQQDQMFAMQDADLAHRQAVLDLKDAQNTYNTAVKEHGKTSSEAERAGLGLEQAQIRVAQSAGDAATELFANTDQTTRNQAATDAVRDSNIFLAATLGNQASPAVKNFTDHLGESELAAYNAQVKTSGFDYQVRQLPDGRTVFIKVDPETGKLVDTQGKIDGIKASSPVTVRIDANGYWTAAGLTSHISQGGKTVATGGVWMGPHSDIKRAGGGILPGYTPGQDVHQFFSPTGGALALSGGEAILRPEVTRALGVGWVSAVNKVARRGGVHAARKFVAGEGVMGDTGVTGSGQAAFADGGVFVNPADAVQAASDEAQRRANNDMGRQWKEYLSSGGVGLQFAMSQVGKPYIWGSAGPNGYDCSGFMSAILNVMRGVNPPYKRVGATGNFPWSGFQPGFGPGLNIGSTRNTGSGIGHMAGTIGGVNVESRGGKGVVVGAGARGAADGLFNTHAHWAPGYGGGSGGIGAALAELFEGVAVGGVRATVQSVANRRGWGDDGQWNALSWLLDRESGWNPTAQNPRSTAYGLFQFLNGTWGSVGGYKTSDPGLQTEFGLRYIASKYGSPVGAQNFHMRHGWYDQGGILPPGDTLVRNGTGKPEAVFTNDQMKSGMGNTYNIHLDVDLAKVKSLDDIIELVTNLEQAKRQGGRQIAGVKR